MNCPMCGLAPKYQVDVKEDNNKSQCKGCGTKFFNREKIY